jgi:hypothetical protein
VGLFDLSQLVLIFNVTEVPGGQNTKKVRMTWNLRISSNNLLWVTSLLKFLQLHSPELAVTLAPVSRDWVCMSYFPMRLEACSNS